MEQTCVPYVCSTSIRSVQYDPKPRYAAQTNYYSIWNLFGSMLISMNYLHWIIYTELLTLNYLHWITYTEFNSFKDETIWTNSTLFKWDVMNKPWSHNSVTYALQDKYNELSHLESVPFCLTISHIQQFCSRRLWKRSHKKLKNLHKRQLNC